MVSALVLSLVLKTFFFQSFWIPSGSMEPTLQLNDRILVTKWRPGVLDLRRGDIVVFKDPGGWLEPVDNSDDTPLEAAGKTVLTFTGLLPEDAGEHLVKRVVGLPGETIECCDADGRLLVDGEPLHEDYLVDGIVPSETDFTTTVPANYVWVMGDNRPHSADSRAHQGNPGGGSVPISSIVGTAFVTVWPLQQWQTLGNPYENPDAVED
ncbi:signal peptidase I [Demequina muriae]|uniref:Signal peptidase I n=1 Tax=Demequina muriae TaxID=3051664 RepID=A0ABT8GDW8_9MICO|nr:signal peptidase I [Demequina sp. EGI L300058]MDN4479621.1 signal peptidase I [Demequina sp. EGI L300058]